MNLTQFCKTNNLSDLKFPLYLKRTTHHISTYKLNFDKFKSTILDNFQLKKDLLSIDIFDSNYNEILNEELRSKITDPNILELDIEWFGMQNRYIESFTIEDKLNVYAYK